MYIFQKEQIKTNTIDFYSILKGINKFNNLKFVRDRDPLNWDLGRTTHTVFSFSFWFEWILTAKSGELNGIYLSVDLVELGLNWP